MDERLLPRVRAGETVERVEATAGRVPGLHARGPAHALLQLVVDAVDVAERAGREVEPPHLVGVGRQGGQELQREDGAAVHGDGLGLDVVLQVERARGVRVEVHDRDRGLGSSVGDVATRVLRARGRQHGDPLGETTRTSSAPPITITSPSTPVRGSRSITRVVSPSVTDCTSRRRSGDATACTRSNTVSPLSTVQADQPRRQRHAHDPVPGCGALLPRGRLAAPHQRQREQHRPPHACHLPPPSGRSNRHLGDAAQESAVHRSQTC